MTKKELINALQNSPIGDDDKVLVSLVECDQDQYSIPKLIPVDYVWDRFINIAYVR